MLTDEADPGAAVRRGHEEIVDRGGQGRRRALGIEVSSAVFDRVRTCDNHCEFCFIYQLPKGMRRSLYLKDDDYRLSFLYGNFTTLTRFTELDLERVVDERLSPLYVSIHATDPELRARMLRNRRGATSLRWLRAMLDAGIEVHGQVVVCPGVNDGAALEDTLAGMLDEFPELATVACVPLGVSRFSIERACVRTRPTKRRCGRPVDEWQEPVSRVLGRRIVYAADEYYLIAGRAFPEVETYEGFPQHENGIGMARAFEAAFWVTRRPPTDESPGSSHGSTARPPRGTGLRGPTTPTNGHPPPAPAIDRSRSSPVHMRGPGVAAAARPVARRGPPADGGAAPAGAPTPGSAATSRSRDCSPGPTWPRAMDERKPAATRALPASRRVSVPRSLPGRHQPWSTTCRLRASESPRYPRDGLSLQCRWPEAR